MARRMLVLVGLLSACLAACSDAEDPPPAGPTTSASPSASTPAQTRQPLVLAAHPAAPRVRMSEKQARAVLAGRSPGWSLVDHPEQLARPGTLIALPAAEVDASLRPVVVNGVHPLLDPDAYPLTTKGPTPPSPIRMTVVGDLMLTRGVTDPAGALLPMTRLLAGADITVGTLESTLSKAGTPQQGGDSFAADPAVVRLLERTGFDALSLANNHVGDYQQDAMLATVNRLRRSDIRPFGAGRDLSAATRAAVVVRGGVRFGFVGFNAIGETPRATPGQAGALSVRMPPRTGTSLNQADLRHVELAIRRLGRQVDAVVVLPHWGTQYTHVAEPVQRTVARRLSRAGADLVVGGHPHWVQGLDLVGDTLVAHSLGNFVFDMDFMTETQQGVVLETIWWGDELKGFELVPYRMDDGFAPRRASGAEAADVLGDVRDASFGPFRGG